jgi:hypothetical protein
MAHIFQWYQGGQLQVRFMLLTWLCGWYSVIYLQFLVLEVIRIVDAAPPL